MKRLIPNITKMQMGGEPPKKVKPIYVSNKNDPRLRAYQDSLSLYNKYPSSKTDYDITHKLIRKRHIEEANKYINSYSNANIREMFKKVYDNINIVNSSKINPIGIRYGNKIYSSGNSDEHSRKKTFTYKKPVQPVVYRPKVTPTVIAKPKSKIIPKVTPTVNNKKIQMETTKIDTTPVVQPTPKTPPTPLTKKQYYEVPDANGKITLLTPEQFSRMSSGNKNDLMSKSPIMNKPKYFYEMNSSGKRQLVPESKIIEYMQTKNR